MGKGVRVPSISIPISNFPFPNPIPIPNPSRSRLTIYVWSRCLTSATSCTKGLAAARRRRRWARWRTRTIRSASCPTAGRARSKILNLYTSHFERELEDDNSHLLDSGDWLHTVPDEEAVRPGNSLSLVNSPKNLCSHICQVTQNRKRLHGE